MPYSQHYEVIVNPADGENRSIDVFPPIPLAQHRTIRRALSQYLDLLVDRSPVASVMTPVNINDEAYGPGSHILVRNHTRNTTFSWMERYISTSLNVADPVPPNPSDWETDGGEICEDVVVSKKYL